MSKCATFLTALEVVLASYSRDTVKVTIGDSINNNRTLTVNQVVRFLSGRSNRKLGTVGLNLTNMYELVRGDITKYRTRYTYRTDAIDINEFIDYFDRKVLNASTSVVRSVGRQLENL